MAFPDPNQKYDGPDRDPPLWTQFEAMTKEAHDAQPIVIDELLELIQGLFYRLRWSLTFVELAIEVREILRHNEHHIINNNWLLVNDQGESVPLVTPEMREGNPEMAAMAEELLNINLEEIEISPEDFIK